MRNEPDTVLARTIADVMETVTVHWESPPWFSWERQAPAWHLHRCAARLEPGVPREWQLTSNN